MIQIEDLDKIYYYVKKEDIQYLENGFDSNTNKYYYYVFVSTIDYSIEVSQYTFSDLIQKLT